MGSVGAGGSLEVFEEVGPGDKVGRETNTLMEMNLKGHLDASNVPDYLVGLQFPAMESGCRKLIRADDAWIYQYGSRPENSATPSSLSPKHAMVGEWRNKRIPEVEELAIPCVKNWLALN